MSRGASANTTLYGPGNSQPHKVAVCVKGKTHYVDVHAVKSYGGAGACATEAPTPAPASTSAVAAPAAQAPAALAADGRGRCDASSAEGEEVRTVLAASRDGDEEARREAISGVLGAQATRTTLPFTGMPLWLPALLSLVLTGAGLGMLRTARSRA
jgi:hypothetical protein